MSIKLGSLLATFFKDLLLGKSKGKVERQSIINPDWDFTKMGIGGLGTEFNAIFRSYFLKEITDILFLF